MALPDKGRKWTIEEYEEFSQQAEDKYEFYYGEVYPVYPPEPGQPQSMAGATRRHNLISGNIYFQLYGQLSDRCELYPGEMKVQANSNARFFPDIVALCGDPKFTDESEMILLNPTVIFEVLSPSTQKFDQTTKLQAYHTMTSLQAYVLVSQQQMHIMHYARQANTTWTLRSLTQPEDVLQLPAIGCTLRVADIYRKVTFDA